MKILTINPGSTSTKIGIFHDETAMVKKTIAHSAKELAAFPTLIDQLGYRENLILETIKNSGFNPSDFDGIIGRGGVLRPIESGVYKINEDMINDLRSGKRGLHASNLGGLLAHAIAGETGKDAYIADPVVVDELWDIARVTGHPLIVKPCIFHALNHKAIARKHCTETSTDYSKSTLIVVHLGGGISVALHQNGRVVDVNNALDGEGPFSPERCGSLPSKQLIELCCDGGYTKNELLSMIQPKGGLVAYLGTNDFREAFEMTENDPAGRLVVDAMLYKTAKEVGAMAAAACGKVDGVVLTGGMAYSQYVTDYLTNRASFIAPVYVYPGEDELWALASSLLRVLKGQETAKVY